MSNCSRTILCSLPIVLTLLVAGCGQAKLEVPDTYPVNGTLTDRAGKPIADAQIRFRPASGADNLLIIHGSSDAAGSFTLRTMHINDAAQKTVRDGAPVGEYRVTIMPRQETDRKAPPPTVTWKPQTVKIEPKENQVKFEVVTTASR